MDGGKRVESLELASIVILAFVLRLLAGRHSLSEGGVLLSSFDGYYHMRRILYTVNHFPNNIWYDSYLNYPKGFKITWPPLFDQVAAALSLVLGQHSQQGIETVSAFLPVVFGTLTIVVVYFMIREVLTRNEALLSAFLASITFFHIFNSMLGATDHHSLEILLLLASLLFMVIAFCRRDKWYIYAGLSGLFLAGLAYNWYGTIIYLGIFLLYAAVQMTIDLRSGSSLKETAITLLTSFGVSLIFLLPNWNAAWLSLSFFGLIIAAIIVLLMFLISSFIAGRRINWHFFPVIVLIFLTTSLLVIYLRGGVFIGNVNLQSGINYLFGGSGAEISEAKPLLLDLGLSGLFFSYLGWNLLLSVAGIIASIWLLRKSDAKINKGLLLVLVWTISAIVLTLGQSRFLYISSIAFAILISILFFQLVALVDKRMSAKQKNVPKAFIIGLLIILMAPTLAETVDAVKGMPFSIGGDWYETLNWLKNNSNSTSFYDNPKERPEYSVMSNWDYGNWIVQVAERPVVANNFQIGMMDSIKFFLSQDEEVAASLLDSRGSKYVVVDYDMFYLKLPALLREVKEDPATYFLTKEYGTDVAFIPLPKLLNTTLAKLYLFDGAGTEHFRLVYESDTLVGTSPPKSKVKIFEYVPGALIRISTGPDQRVGALVNMTSNQKRDFVYVNQALPHDGQFELMVPYSTERRYETHALGPYLIFSGNEKGIRTQNINISEQDVVEGRIIDVAF